MTTTEEGRAPRFDVAGYRQERPFRIRRLGHVGLNCVAIEECLRFYRDTLGFRVSDRIDFSQRAENPESLRGLGDPSGYFMRHGTDHHSFVLFNKQVREALDTTRRFGPGITVNQISWQVGSLREVVAAESWLRGLGQVIQRSGRDMPGSNWHTYFYDEDGHTNELFYGMEQVGWPGISKPTELHRFGARTTPALPQQSETAEVSAALADGIDLGTGAREVPTAPARFDVGGVLLPRPFKIVRIGPLRLFVEDMAAARRFYEHVLGLRVSAEVDYDGARCVLLRANTEHHSIGLYPIQLRERLGVSAHSTTFTVGMQVGGYRQLRDARAFLLGQGMTEVTVPPELFPGLGRAFRVRDPDGHLIELYDRMYQVVPPAPEAVPADDWPDAVDDDGFAFLGEPYLGPLE